MTDPIKILFKYPSRGRLTRFYEGLDSIVDNVVDKENYQVVVSVDNDDDIMNGIKVIKPEEKYGNVVVCIGDSKSKIDAVNRDIEKAKEWDVVVVMSDDMRFIFYGFDDIIRQQFYDGDFDKLIHIPDQDAKSALATMYIAGKTFYNRFGYVYHPEYESLFCDNEVHEVAVMLGKYRFVNVHGVLIHLNPAYGHLPKDELFIRQQATGWTKDQETYNRRKANNFYLTQTQIQ